jgi:predicted nucleic acid-binding protein
MMAADTSSLVAFFSGGSGSDVEMVAAAALAGALSLPPVVLTEMLSDPLASETLEPDLSRLVLLDIGHGYWLRAAQSRRALLRRGLKAKVADALIAQSCIDHDVALITRDRDFRHFADHCGLKLA